MLPQDIPAMAKLLAGTLDFTDLESFVLTGTGEGLYDAFVAENQPKIPMIEQLLKRLEQMGTTAAFLTIVYRNRPGRPDVRKAIVTRFPEVATYADRKIDLSAQTAGAAQGDASGNAFDPGLQRNVRPYLEKVNVRVWLERLSRIERQVCRVELEGNALGTGFLVGPDTVLTNWHVFEIAKKAGKSNLLGCRFVYERLPDGSTRAGKLVMIDAQAGVESSPYSPAEATPDPNTPLPTEDQLDYALMRLSSRTGEEQIDGVARGWITLPTAPLPTPADSPILIVQHPDGGPMKLALDTQAVIGMNANNTRLRYRTNTDPGSSGSPVFTMDWDIVALHHYGDPKYQNPLFNQGVPIDLIRRRIEKNGFAASLGA